MEKKMAKFYSIDGITRFNDGGEYDVELDQYNSMVFISESQPLKDRVAVLDTRDDGWWSWYRFEHDPEDFEEILGAVALVGTVVYSPNPQTAVENDLEGKIHYLSNYLEDGIPEDW